MSFDILQMDFQKFRRFLEEGEREMFIDSGMARVDEDQRLLRLIRDSLKNCENKLERAQAVSFCAVEGGTPRGYVFANVNGIARTAFVTSVYVAPRYRKQGVGRSLMEHLLTHLEGQAIPDVGLAVTSTNEQALNLYESLGFEIKRHVMRRNTPRNRGATANTNRREGKA